MKMRRKAGWSALLAIVLALLCIIVPSALAERVGKTFDDAGLLSSDEIAALNDRMDTFRADYDIDIGFVSTNDAGGKTIEAFADDFYDDPANGFAEDGLILAIDMGSRQFHVSTCGSAIAKIPDASLEALLDAIAVPLGNGDFAGAAQTFVQTVDDTFAYDASGGGMPSDVGGTTSGIVSQNGSQGNVVAVSSSLSPGRIAIYFLIALGVALVICGIMVAVHKSSLRSQPAAAHYQDEKGFVMTEQRDDFLRTHTSRTARPKDDDSSHRSGGSSTHTSSSGRTHGGGGRSF